MIRVLITAKPIDRIGRKYVIQRSMRLPEEINIEDTIRRR